MQNWMQVQSCLVICRSQSAQNLRLQLTNNNERHKLQNMYRFVLAPGITNNKSQNIFGISKTIRVIHFKIFCKILSR